MITFNDTNVYILGAGLSAERGLPVMANFLDLMRDSQAWLIGEDRHEEYDAAVQVLTFRLNASAAGYRVRLDLDNIEDLFSLASAAGDKGLLRSISIAIAATLEYAEIVGERKHVILCRQQDSPPPISWVRNGNTNRDNFIAYDAPLFHLIAGSLGGDMCVRGPHRRDVAITFNYDTLLEESASELGISLDYGLGTHGVSYANDAPCLHPTANNESATHPGLRLLKLHGSVNWGLNPDGTLAVRRDYASVRKLRLEPAIIPPTWRKLATGPLESVWASAVQAVREATRIIFVGFSLPPTDLYVKYLLAAGLRENISLRQILIVDRRSDPVFQRAAEVFDERLLRREQLEHRSMPASQFFTTHSALAAIGRKPDAPAAYVERVGVYEPKPEGGFHPRF